MGACGSSPIPEEEYSLQDTSYNDLHPILKALRQPRSLDEHVLDPAPFRLYQVYIIQCFQRGRKLEKVMNPKTFFLYLAIFLAEKNNSFKTVDETQLRQILGELSTPTGSFDLTVDHVLFSETEPATSTIKLLHSIYGFLAAEEELFGTALADRVRRDYPDHNRYSLTFISDLRETMPKVFSLTGRELFKLLSKHVSDYRTIDLLSLYEELTVGVLSNEHVASSASSSPLSTSSGARPTSN